MTTTDLRPEAPRFDRLVLRANLVSGAVVVLAVALVSWPLALVGAAYVVVVSGFLAAVAGHDDVTRAQETVARAVPWLLAVGLWSSLLAAPDGNPSVLGAIGGALLVVTPAYAVWQLGAAAARQVLAGR